jgi:hypothetical protein
VRFVVQKMALWHIFPRALCWLSLVSVIPLILHFIHSCVHRQKQIMEFIIHVHYHLLHVLILNPPPPPDIIFLWRVQVMNLSPHVKVSNLLLLPPSQPNFFSQHSVLKCPLYVLSLEWVTKFHTHTKQHVKLQICIAKFSHF